MIIRVTVYNVAEATENNTTIGLAAGNLLWASSTLAGYKVGIIDQNSFSGLTRSVANIVNGGTFSNGFTGTIKVEAKNATLVSLLQSKSLVLNGKTCKIEASLDGSTWHGIAMFPITTASISDELSVTLKISTDTVADKKKISSAAVTQEMALNNPDSDAIGKTVPNVYGRNVLYPLIYCEPKQGDLATMLAPSGLLNGVAYDPLRGDLTHMMMTNDLKFVKGSSLLQCCGAWQSSTDSQVWLAFSFNGKELLADSDPGVYLPLVKKALIGQRIKATHGKGSGNLYTVVNVDWASHTVAFNSTAIETLWFQVNTTEIDNFNYTLPNYDGTAQEGSAPLKVYGYNSATGYTNLFTQSVKDGSGRDFDVTHMSFQLDAGLFIVNASANVTDCEIYGNVDDTLQKVSTPSNVEVVYKNEKWQLVKIPLAQGIDAKEAKFDEVSTSELNTYLLEQDLTYPTDEKLNGVINVSGGGTIVRTLDNVPTGVNGIGSAGYALSNSGFDSMSKVITYNAIYTESVAEMWESDNSICVIPEFKIQIANLGNVGQDWNYKAKLTIDVFAISEGNVAIARKTGTVDAVFRNLDPYSESGKLWLKPSTRLLSFSSDVVSHEIDSASAYSLLEKALTFSENDLPETRNQVKAFLTVVSVDYNDSIFDSRNLSKVFYPSRYSVSKTIAKKNLYLKCVDSSSVSTPAGIAKRILESNGVTCDTSSFAAAELAQRAYFSEVAANFDGQYTAESTESMSDAVDNICKNSMVVVWLDAEGTAKAKALGSLPDSVVYEFGGVDIKKDSLKISQGDLANTFCDFDFSILENIVTPESVVSMDTSADNFPPETAYKLGTVVISTTDGYSFYSYNFTPAGEFGVYQTLRVRGPSLNMLGMFAAGTYWHFDNGVSSMVFRIDTTAPDLTCPLGYYGINLGLRYVEAIADDPLFFTGTVEARLWGPNEAWRDLVSGTAAVSYGSAKSMWESAKAARELLGSEIKAPSELTEMGDPVWGSDRTAISNWMNATVNYCTREKFVVKFETDITDSLLALDVMSYVSFKWGIYKTNSVQGFVAEKSTDFKAGTIAFTLVCYGSVLALPTLLTEAGISFSTETGSLFELEDESQSSTKISELTESTPEALAEAGAVIPTATQDLANNKVSLLAIADWISAPLTLAINTLSDALGNKVDKVQTSLQTMLGALKMPFLNLYSSMTGVLPAGAEEGAIWYDGQDKRPKYFDGTDVRLFGTSSITDHNNLSGIQGGTTGEYYHDNLTQHNQKVNAGAANGYALLNASAKLPTGNIDADISPTSGSAKVVTSGGLYVKGVTDAESLRANVNVTGGGVVSVSSTWEVGWTKRFIVISNGRGSHFATSGFFDIAQPTAGTVITGVGGASNATTTANGIPLSTNTTALYYVLPIGSSNASQSANFRLCSYSSDVEVPATWVLLACRNPDTQFSTLTPNGGFTLKAGESWNVDSSFVTLLAGKAPTSHASAAASYGVASATNYGHAMASSATPLMDGTASAGTNNGKFAREGHIHPTDTSRAASVHSHAIADVNNLQTTLDVKDGIITRGSNYTTFDFWWDGFSAIIATVQSYPSQQLIGRVRISGGAYASKPYTATIWLSVKDEEGSISYNMKIIDATTDSVMFKWRTETDAYTTRICVGCFLPAYCSIDFYVLWTAGSGSFAIRNEFFSNTEYNTYFTLHEAEYGFQLPTTVYAPTSAGSYELPSNVPIGKTVIVDNSDCNGTTYVNPPSGTTLYDTNGNQGQQSISSYCGRWFVKTKTNRWIAQA